MSPAQRETDLRSRVLEHFDELPPQQQLIADYLLENLREVPFLSVPELAKRIGTSEATVVRFAQRIGYSGFSGLKMHLLELLREQVISATDTAAPSEENVSTDVLEAVGQLERNNIQRSLERIERKDFRGAAAALFKADHVFTFGLGISAYLSELASYMLTQIGLRATPLSSKFSSPREQLVAFRPSDLLLAFSFPPYSRQTVEMVAEVSQTGIPTVVVTDKLTAPAATSGRYVFPIRSDNMMFTNSVSAVTVLLNALATEIAVRHQGHAVEVLSQINRILEADEDLLDGVG